MVLPKTRKPGCAPRVVGGRARREPRPSCPPPARGGPPARRLPLPVVRGRGAAGLAAPRPPPDAVSRGGLGAGENENHEWANRLQPHHLCPRATAWRSSPSPPSPPCRPRGCLAPDPSTPCTGDVASCPKSLPQTRALTPGCTTRCPSGWGSPRRRTWDDSGARRGTGARLPLRRGAPASGRGHRQPAARSRSCGWWRRCARVSAPGAGPQAGASGARPPPGPPSRPPAARGRSGRRGGLGERGEGRGLLLEAREAPQVLRVQPAAGACRRGRGRRGSAGARRRTARRRPGAPGEVGRTTPAHPGRRARARAPNGASAHTLPARRRVGAHRRAGAGQRP